MNWSWTFLSGFRNGAGDELLYIWKLFCTCNKNNIEFDDKLTVDGWFWNLRRKLALNSLAIVESTFKISANLSFPAWCNAEFRRLRMLKPSPKIVQIFKLTNAVDDSIDNTFSPLSLNMCDTINVHPQPAGIMGNHKNLFS